MIVAETYADKVQEDEALANQSFDPACGLAGHPREVSGDIFRSSDGFASEALFDQEPPRAVALKIGFQQG